MVQEAGLSAENGEKMSIYLVDMSDSLDPFYRSEKLRLGELGIWSGESLPVWEDLMNRSFAVGQGGGQRPGEEIAKATPHSTSHHAADESK